MLRQQAQPLLRAPMVPKLDTLSKTLSALGNPGSLRFVLSDPLGAAKLESLKAQGRDFLAITPELKADLALLVEQGLARSMGPDRIMRSLGEQVLAAAVARIEGSRTDVAIRPSRSGHRPGVNTGELLASLKTASVEVTK